jgi:energy-converting hydrogenase Eha subunit H
MSITESLKAQLKTLEAQRRQHEKAANAIRRNEVKIRKALSSVASLSSITQSLTCFNSF